VEVTKSSDDYLQAAAIVEAEGDQMLTQKLIAKAAVARERENYIKQLGLKFDPAMSAVARGSVIIHQLIADGWIPPKGLV
jgi:hypothetical protein